MENENYYFLKNRTVIEKYREHVIERVEANVPLGKKIHLDKELLEALLFDTITRKDGVVVKIPVWSGSFLEKIDLSEVSFEDVSWGLLTDPKQDGWDEDTFNYILALSERLCKRPQPVYGFGHTNAHIDFNTSYEAKYYSGKRSIKRADFAGISLKGTDISMFSRIQYCNFRYTGISLSSLDDIKCIYCDFSGNDFSNITISAIKLNHQFINCIMSDTKLNITCDPRELNRRPEEKKNFIERYNDHQLNGCFINGKFVHTAYERKMISKREKERYAQAQEHVESVFDEAFKRFETRPGQPGKKS